MYINIGAYVGEGTLIDSHALVGSCAQIGARVHISAAAQIGGVIEPVGALPVIIEDDVLVGGNTGIYEGAVVKARAVIAAGTVLTGSTPVYDLPNGRIIKPEAGQPLVVPEGAVVVPGARAVTVGAGKEWGLSLATPVIVKYRDARTDTRTELEAVDPVDLGSSRWRGALVDIDSTTGPEGERAAAWLADYLRGRGYHGDGAAGRRRRASTSLATSARRGSCSPRTSTACRRFFRAALEGDAPLRPRVVRRQGHPRGAGRGGRAAARRRRSAHRPAVRRRRGARQRRGRSRQHAGAARAAAS